MKSKSNKLVRNTIFILASIMIFVSIAAGVYSYEVINSDDYRLLIENVEISSEEFIKFTLYNHGSEPYPYLEMDSYRLNFNGDSTFAKFSHSEGKPLSVTGVLNKFGEEDFTLPFDHYGNTQSKLRCGKALTVEIINNRGIIIAKWTGIPKCLISAPMPEGLQRLSNTTAEYNDDSISIQWKLLEADSIRGRVKLSTTKGLVSPKISWYSHGECPDVEAGKCMTSISLTFSADTIWVTLSDKRKGTTVTLDKSLLDNNEIIKRKINNNNQREIYQHEMYISEQNEKENMLNVKEIESTTIGEVESIPITCETGERDSMFDIPVYCEQNTWIVQKTDSKKCNNDYECRQNSCNNNICSQEVELIQENKQSWIMRLLQWIDNLI